MVIGLALLLALADAPDPTPPKNEIVVRGTSLKALDDALDRCVAAHCPVRDDVIASVRYAEALFRAAHYLDARKALQKAIDRDRSRARGDPFAVAALYEATATVATHEGEQDVAAKATFDRARLLRETQAVDSFETLRAELDVADLEYGRGAPLRAEQRFRLLAERAEAANQPLIVAAANLRRAQVEHVAGADGLANRLLDGIIAGETAYPVGYRLAAYAMKARIARARGEAAATDAFRAALARWPQQQPVLLSAPPPPRPADIVDMNYFDRLDTHTRSGDILPLRWADIAFSIRPDGHADGAEVLRGNLPAGDAAAITQAIARRSYAPFPAEQGEQYRVERWTLTADYATPTDSLIRQRIRNPHYAALDITTGAPPPKAPALAGGTGR